MDVAGPGAEPDAAELRLDDVPSYQETTEVARNNDVLKVSSKSRPSAVAGAIAGVVRELGRAEVQAIGAGATNQAIKAVAIARDYLHETGIDAICLPEFIDITIDNEDRTAIRLVIEPR
jgi:stage V sporulation protein S